MARSRKLALFRVGILTALVSWTAPAVASEGSSAEGRDQPSQRLALRWCNPHRLFDSGWQRVGKELQRTLEAIDVASSWKRCDQETGAPPEQRIRVVLVRSDPADWGLSPQVMGAVLSQNRPQSEVYVFFNGVARALGYSPEVRQDRWPSAQEKRELARAMSRVIVHEIVHAVLPTRPHASEGLTRSRLDRTALLGAKMHLNASAAAELRSALGRPGGVIARLRSSSSERRLGAEPERVSKR